METRTDEETWGGLEAMRASLRSWLGRHCADANEVEDVIHEAYLRAYRYRRHLRGRDRLGPWTRRIALNVLADRRRREERYVNAPAEPGEPGDLGDTALGAPQRSAATPDDVAGGTPDVRIGRFEVEHGEAIGLLRRAFGAMSDADRRLLGSFYGGAGSCRETAERCDIPARLVKVRLFRARQRLCRAMRHRVALEHRNPDRPIEAEVEVRP